MIWQTLPWLNLKRRWLRQRKIHPLIRDYLRAPIPSGELLYSEVDYLVLDLETTGLHPKKDQIVTIGFTEISDLTLQLSRCVHSLVCPSQEMSEESAVIHGILDDQAQKGADLSKCMPPLIKTLAGKVLIAHYASVEIHFIQAACRMLYGATIPIPVIDTLFLEYQKMMRDHTAPKRGDLRLANVRSRYNLPRYPAHDALSDAIATGELFLAQTDHRSVNNDLRLKDLISPVSRLVRR
ncbi:exonuclease domain-containing protein [Magnetococcales bacterium HHB-1]